MCCCGKPTINGESGYSWDGQRFSTRPISPPDLAETDELLYDEPGRCGGLDCHSHHFRIVKVQYGGHALLVRHGGGDERIGLGVISKLFLPSMAGMDTNARYWLMHMIYSTHSEAESASAQRIAAIWRKAAAEKRIKTRKVRTGVKVWFEPETPARSETAQAA
jgi:hypothetical protein